MAQAAQLPSASPTLDAPLPRSVAARASDAGVAKAGTGSFELSVLAILAGAFIALGAMFATVAGTGMADVPYGAARVLTGLVFSLGLVLVVVAGAELFTGNNLIVMAWADRRIRLSRLLRNWGIVYIGNLAGALATALLVLATRQHELAGGAVGRNALEIAQHKASLGFAQAFALGVLANALVCLAVWLSYAARSVTDKVIAVVFPVTAFVAAGFEHSIANMYFLPIAVLIRDTAGDGFWAAAGAEPEDYAGVGWGEFALGLVPVTLGNVVGGALLVGAVYWLVYRRPERHRRPRPAGRDPGARNGHLEDRPGA